MTRLMSRIFPFADRADRHGGGSHRHAWSKTDLQAERDQLIGLFVD